MKFVKASRTLILGGLVLSIQLHASAQPVRRTPPPPPVDASLATKDGVQLKITYYASSAGQDATPVVMLHDLNETRAVFDPLAQTLQNPRPPADNAAANPVQSRAVVTVDLRGHGGSKTAYGADGSVLKLDANRFQPVDFENMIQFDLEAVRAFLIAENDAGKLNLNKLCVVGSGMGANAAVLWAAKDWATPPLAARKQGQDVKALALISPRWNFRGLSLVGPMKFPPIQRDLAILLAYGAEDAKVAKDCQNLQKVFERHHPEPPADLVQEQKDYFVIAANTRLQGSELLTTRGFNLAPTIAGFIEARVGRQDMPYVRRKY